MEQNYVTVTICISTMCRILRFYCTMTLVPRPNNCQHCHHHPLNGPLSATTQVSRYQKGKTNLDFTGARDSGWQWHQLGICKSAPCSRQITTPAPHHSVFTGRMPFLPPNQQRQSTEDITANTVSQKKKTIYSCLQLFQMSTL